MTDSYMADAGKALNTIFQLYKNRLSKLPKQPDYSDEKAVDKAADWWSEVMNDFVAAVDMTEDEDIRNFVGYFASACISDLQDKYQGIKRHVALRHIGQIEPENIPKSDLQKGDCFRVGNIELEVRNVWK